jgi:hypothetical protein
MTRPTGMTGPHPTAANFVLEVRGNKALLGRKDEQVQPYGFVLFALSTYKLGDSSSVIGQNPLFCLCFRTLRGALIYPWTK